MFLPVLSINMPIHSLQLILHEFNYSDCNHMAEIYVAYSSCFEQCSR